MKCAWYLHSLPIHLLISDYLLQSPVDSNFRLIGSWLHSQRSSIMDLYIAVTRYITVTYQLPKNFQFAYIFCNVDLYIAVILHLTITLQFPKSDRCTQVWLCVLLHWILPCDTKIGTKNLLDLYHIDWNVFIRVDTVALFVFIVVQGHITVEWSPATLQLLDWKHKSSGCTKSNSHWTANFDGRGYEVSNDSCCLVIVSCSWLLMVISLVGPRSWVHWSGVKPQSQFR